MPSTLLLIRNLRNAMPLMLKNLCCSSFNMLNIPLCVLIEGTAHNSVIEIVLTGPSVAANG